MAEPAGGVGRFGAVGVVEAAEDRPCERGLKVRHRVDGHGRPAVVGVQPERPGAPGDIATDGHAGMLEELVGHRHASGRVVVAGDGDDLGAGVMQPHQGLVEKGDGVGGRDGPVVQVTRDHDEVHLGVFGQCDQPVDGLALLGQQRLTVEGPPQVPVGGV